MPLRTTPLVVGEHYHVYNRGVAGQPVFLNKREYERFILCLSYYRFKDLPVRLSRLLQLDGEEREQILSNLHEKNDKLVDLIAFCLMPNHFHILLQQLADGGISTFLKQITASYTLYFNVKNERVGPLFQGAFKAVRIESDEQLLHVSRYIHLNPLVSYVVKDADFMSYPWSSLREYMSATQGMTNPKPILDHFKGSEEYVKFVLDQADYGKELEKIKHLAHD